MSAFLVRNARLVNPGRYITTVDVLVREGRLAAVGVIPTAAIADAGSPTVIDGRGRLLTPGLIDIHTHGVMHSLYQSGPDGLRGAARELGRFGVTTVLPTIVPQIHDGWLENLSAIAEAIPSVRE